jgi:predicted SAM-dependent methyltransferase
MRIILGAGKEQRLKGWKTQDQFEFEGIDYVFDLNEKWPLDDNSCTSLIACHVLEHLRDFLHFHNEAHRVLKPGGTLYLETPSAHGLIDLIWSDPTHVRPYTPHSWINYLTIDGIDKFGYTNKCWGSLHIETRGGNLIVHAMPIK